MIVVRTKFPRLTSFRHIVIADRRRRSWVRRSRTYQGRRLRAGPVPRSTNMRGYGTRIVEHGQVDAALAELGGPKSAGQGMPATATKGRRLLRWSRLRDPISSQRGIAVGRVRDQRKDCARSGVQLARKGVEMSGRPKRTGMFFFPRIVRGRSWARWGVLTEQVRSDWPRAICRGRTRSSNKSYHHSGSPDRAASFGFVKGSVRDALPRHSYT